jgi:hypothetical protein
MSSAVLHHRKRDHMQRRLIVLTITADPEELRYLASCIDVGNENDEATAFHYNQADALSSKLNRIADALELNATPDGMDFMVPFIQDGVAQGPSSLPVDQGTPTH